MSTIKLVRNDTAPQLRLAFINTQTGSATDLTAATVTLHFRAVNTTTALFSRVATISPPATNGIAVLGWLVGDLDHPAGEYEGEVEVVLGTGTRETIFDLLEFEIREEIA
jgi:hypothetical protein